MDDYYITCSQVCHVLKRPRRISRISCFPGLRPFLGVTPGRRIRAPLRKKQGADWVPAFAGTTDLNRQLYILSNDS